MAEEVKLILTLEEQQFIRDSKRALDAVNKNTKAFAGLKGSVVSFNAALQVATTAFRAFSTVGRQVVSISRDVVTAASDFAEESQKFGVVFGDISDAANQTRDDLVESFGLSRLESTRLLGATGDLLTGFGFTQKSALNLSEQVNRLAVDLASFTNFSGGAAGASERLTKGLLGEVESLKTLGIAIRQDTPAFRGLVQTIQQSEGVTLNQAKALAVLQIAQEQSKNAIGDYARSSSSLANQSRLLNSRFEDLQVTIGEALAPALNVLTGQAIGVIENFTKLGEAQKAAISIQFIDLLQTAIQGFVLLQRAIGITGEIFQFLAGTAAFAIGGIVDLVGGLGAAIIDSFAVIGRTVVKGFKFIAKETAESIADLAETLVDVINFFDKEAGKGLQSFASTARGVADDFDKSFENAGIFGAGATDKVTAIADEFFKFGVEAFSSLGTISEMNDEITELGGVSLGKLELLKDGMRSVKTETDAANEAVKTLNSSFGAVDFSVGLEQQNPIGPQLGGSRNSEEAINEFVQAEQRKADIARQFREITGQAALDDLMAKTDAELAIVRQAEEEKLINAKQAKEAEFLIIQEDMLAREALKDEEQQRELERLAELGDAEAQQALILQESLAGLEDQVNKNLVKSFQTLGSQVSSVFLNVIDGTKTAKEGFKELGKSILQNLIGSLIQAGTQYLINSLLRAVGAKGEVLAASGVAFANTFASIAAIPIIGPALAPAAASAAKAAVIAGGSFQTGTDFVGDTGVFRLHRGERVVPTQTNTDLTRFLREQADRESGREGVGGIINVNVETFVGDEEFADSMAQRVSEAIELRNVDFRG